LFLKGRELMLGLKKNREIFDRWMTCFRRAIELDPNYSDAYAGLSMGYCLDHQNRWSDQPEATIGSLLQPNGSLRPTVPRQKCQSPA
jgi:adenylate cyclase